MHWFLALFIWIVDLLFVALFFFVLYVPPPAPTGQHLLLILIFILFLIYVCTYLGSIMTDVCIKTLKIG
jgi:hypothetical protein